MAGINADLMIAAMGRSGSTMLANKFTSPDGSLIFTEPFLVKGGGNRNVVRGLKIFNKNFSESQDLKWLKRIYDRNPRVMIREMTNKYMSNVGFWGVKEVDGELFRDTFKLIRPRKVIILVRSLDQVFLSFYEKSVRQGREEVWGVDWIKAKMDRACAAQIKLYESNKDKCLVVRYEDMVSSPDFIKELAEKVGYNYGFGNEGMFLDEHNRSWELNRNKNRLEASISIEDRGIPLEIEGHALEYLASKYDYNSTFGL